jgi:peptide/nickel transport system permease protein
MSQYILRRLLLMIPTLLGVSLLVTGMLRLMPGDAVDIMVTENATSGGNREFKLLVDAELESQGKNPEGASFGERSEIEIGLISQELTKVGKEYETASAAERLDAKNVLALGALKDRIRERLGVDKPYIAQWWEWVTNAVRGDFGDKITGGGSVSSEIKTRLPASFQLGIMAMIFAAFVAVPIGVISAVKQDGPLDYLGRGGAIAMLALPSFFVATVLIALAGKWLDYSFPIFYKKIWDDPSTNLQLMVPPAIILGFILSGTLMRITRAQMLEVLRQDYIRTAQSKGLVQRRVVMGHAVRNALLPVVTIIGLQVPILIGGSLVLEQIFGIPGIARYLFASILNRDFPSIIAVNMVIAVLIVFTNLLVDVLYGILDPRVQLS